MIYCLSRYVRESLDMIRGILAHLRAEGMAPGNTWEGTVYSVLENKSYLSGIRLTRLFCYGYMNEDQIAVAVADTERCERVLVR